MGQIADDSHIHIALISLFQNCVDTVGSFTCSVACNTGYESSVSAGVTSCVDIDECSLGECDAITEDCSNTVGKCVQGTSAKSRCSDSRRRKYSALICNQFCPV